MTLWFPKQPQGSALGINGLATLGVTIAQFTIPLVIGFSLLGAAEASSGAPVRSIHLENAALIWIFDSDLLAAIWFGTKDYPADPRRSLPSSWLANGCTLGCFRRSTFLPSAVSSWAHLCR